MQSWAPQAVARLEAVRRDFDRSGLTRVVRSAATEVWRANRDRFQPDELFDDNLTLSLLSSRNLANRLIYDLDDSPRWRPQGISASRDNGSFVLHLKNVRVQIVKAPHGCGREPDFATDFAWTKSEIRTDAGSRNVIAVQTYAEPTLWDTPPSTPVEAFNRCRDVFVIWAAELSSGLTGGWLGLPSGGLGRGPWLGVTKLWWDEVDPAARRDPANFPTGRDDVRSNKMPVPIVKLKPVREDRRVQ